MEFVDSGARCYVVTCKQQDFLPFVCDTCGKKLCLMHRAYVAHGCDGGLKKDIRSLECPTCLKTVKVN